MKRLLYLLLFACALLLLLCAMVICTAAEEQPLPPAWRARVHLCLAPDTERTQQTADAQSDRQAHAQEALPQSVQTPAPCAPVLRVRFVRAHYMAFHYSDKAG